MRHRLPFASLSLLASAAILPACAGGQDPQAADPDTAVSVTRQPAAASTSEWQVRADANHEAAGGFSLSPAEPGTRITSGSFSGILYRPGQSATGTYEVIASVHVLPGSRRAEGYGVFVGGSDLDGDGQRYTYFLLRNDGKYLVKTREGSGTSTVVDWTDSPAIRTLPESAAAGESAANTIVVRVTPNAVTLLVNGERVLRRPRGELPLDGIVGLRVNHGLELHVHALDIGTPATPAE